MAIRLRHMNCRRHLDVFKMLNAQNHDFKKSTLIFLCAHNIRCRLLMIKALFLEFLLHMEVPHTHKEPSVDRFLREPELFLLCQT